jgi:antirestriction protein ArdC
LRAPRAAHCTVTDPHPLDLGDGHEDVDALISYAVCAQGRDDAASGACAPFFEFWREDMKTDVYERVTAQIVSQLEQGVMPWRRPWNAQHSEGRIVRPLRANGIPYQGINVIMLWTESVAKGYAAPIWMTFKQALELKACVRKGEHGSLVVYASSITRSEKDGDSGEEPEREIRFMKGYTVFNVEQIEGLPEHWSAFLCADLDLTPAVRDDHASYIASWMKVLKDDKRAIFTAASHAQRAADFLHGLQKHTEAQAA